MPTPRFIRRIDELYNAQPNAPALGWRDETYSYRDLSLIVDSYTSDLLAADISGHSPLCVAAAKSPQAIALIVACWRIGRRVLLPSPELGADAFDRLCAQAGCAHVLELEGGHVGVRTVDTEPIARPGTGLLLTTSGSTGRPKIVVLAAAGVDRFLSWADGRFLLGRGRAVLNYAPVNFDLCLLDLWATLAAGGQVELVDPSIGVTGDQLAELLRRRGVDVIQAVPMFYRLLADAAAGTAFPRVDRVLFTGDVMAPGLLAALPGLFPNARFHNVYGCTETNDSFMYEVSAQEATVGAPVPIGAPLPGVEALIQDSSGSVVRGPGRGELLVSTPFQADGYLDEQANREKWEPWPDGRTYYRTGDVVRRDKNGLVFLEGRSDFHVKVGGVRINMQEVEAVVLRYPQVAEAAVVAVPHRVAGNQLHLVVRCRPDTALNGLALREHCAANLPKSAIPSVIEIVERALPRTSTGKIDRKIILSARDERV